MTEETALSIKDLWVHYGQTPALAGVCLDVRKGEFLGIIGPNGGGKSTLLKAVLGLLPVSSGDIRLFGSPPAKGRRKAGYVPQITAVDKQFPITLFEVVLSGCLKPNLIPFTRYSDEDKKYALSLIDRVGLSDLSSRQISHLSGGEFQKMLIARAMATKPELLLLDEPTASVDATSREQVYSLLSELNKDITIILVTHDLLAISSQVNRLACLNKTLIYHGEPELNNSIVSNLYGCPVDLIAHGVPHRVLKEHNHVHTEGGGCGC